MEKFSSRFFWDQDGILLTDYLAKGQTINTEYYSSLVVQLKDILREKRRGNVTMEFFQRDPNDFLSRLVTMDETWLYRKNIPETDSLIETKFFPVNNLCFTWCV